MIQLPTVHPVNTRRRVSCSLRRTDGVSEQLTHVTKKSKHWGSCHRGDGCEDRRKRGLHREIVDHHCTLHRPLPHHISAGAADTTYRSMQLTRTTVTSHIGEPRGVDPAPFHAQCPHQLLHQLCNKVRVIDTSRRIAALGVCAMRWVVTHVAAAPCTRWVMVAAKLA